MTYPKLVFDDSLLQAELVEAMNAPPIPLSTEAPKVPGVYGIFHTGTHRLYPPSTLRPVYVGSAISLEPRLAYHRRSLRQARDIRPTDFELIVVTTGDLGLALLAEIALIGIHEPVWNELGGFGSKPQGTLRTAGQEPSPWDRLHPGRLWTRRPGARPSRKLQKWVHDYSRRPPTTSPLLAGTEN